MNRMQLRSLRQRLFRLTLSKKCLIGFLVSAAISIVAFLTLPLYLSILAVILIAVVVYFLVDRFLVKPIRDITLSVIESRPTPEGFRYDPPEIRSGDELELLSDALRRMAADINRKD